MYLLGTGYQRSGKNSRILVEGSVALAMANWEIEYKGDDLPTDNFESLGLEEGILGFIGLNWNLGGDWDAGLNAFGDPPGLFPRDDLAGLEFFTNTIDVQGFTLPFARVRSATNGTDVKGKVSFKASGMSQGDFSVVTTDAAGSGVP